MIEIKDQFLYTSELAKLFHVSEHTIRYYEKIKLLKPSRISESGYKLYGFRAIRRLEQILALRVIDMPIEQITHYLEHKDPDIYNEEINHLEEMVEQKISELKTVQSQIREQKSRVQTYIENGRNAFIKQFPSRYIMPVMPLQSEYAFEISIPDFYNHIISKKEHTLLRNSRNMVIYKINDKLNLCIQIMDHDRKAIDLSGCITLPAGAYLCLFHNTAIEDDYIQRNRKMDEYITRHGLSADTFSIDIYSSNNNIYYEESESSLFQVPVKS